MACRQAAWSETVTNGVVASWGLHASLTHALTAAAAHLRPSMRATWGGGLVESSLLQGGGAGFCEIVCR